MRVWSALVSSALAPFAFAATVTVGCPGGTPGDYSSITAAVAALDVTGPHTINVSGSCLESVVLDQRQRLTIQGPATVQGTGNAAGFVIRNSAVIALRNLTVRGVNAAISIANQSSVTLSGIVAENATNGFALDAFGGATLNGGGANATDFLTLRNSRSGMRCERCVAFFAGHVTVEDNTGDGMVVDGGRIELSGQQPAQSPGPGAIGGPNIIRNNGNNGINISSGGIVEFGRENFIQNNAGSGALLTTGSVLNFFGNVLPDGVTKMGTIVEGHPRTGVAVLMNSTFRASGPHRIRNNGLATDEFRSGVSATHNSLAWLGGAEITNQTGRGLTIDSGSTGRLDHVTFSGISEMAIRVQTGGILESLGSNSIPATSIVCDGTAIVFGDLTGVAPFECEKDKKK